MRDGRALSNQNQESWETRQFLWWRRGRDL